MVAWSSKARECSCFSLPSEQAPLLEPPEEEANEDEEGLPPSVIQFSTSNFFCMEEEGFASVDVVRLGDAGGVARCHFRTEDGSAKAGIKFVATSGELEFAPGQTLQTVKIPLLAEDAWDSSLEFSMVITKVVRARRGQYLKRCMVSIIDNDGFPTNKYREQSLDQKALAALPGISILIEYLRMNFQNRTVRRTTLLLVASDQIKNFYFLLTLYLQMYLVDVVLKKEGEGGEGHGMEEEVFEGERRLGEEEFPVEMELLVPGSRHWTAVVVGLLYIVPFAATHLIDYLKWKMKLPGVLRKILQSALLRRFLTFREDIKGSVSEGDISMAITRDISEVVECGYMKVIVLSSALGKLFYAMLFVLSENKLAALPLGVFIVVGGLFLLCREERTVSSSEHTAYAQNQLVHLIHDVIERERLICDFQLRPYVVKRFESVIDNYNNRSLNLAIIMGNNSYLPPWITTILVGGYMVVGTFQVKALGGKLSLGAYLATLAVFKEVGKEMQEIYMEVIEILKVQGPLRTIYFFMNQPTVLPQQMERNRRRRATGREKREEARKTHGEGISGAVRSDDGKYVFAVDTLEIELTDVTFRYGSKLMIDKLSYKFRQGQFHGVVGPEQQGKATLLRILGGQLVPQEGLVFMPVHMRCLHIGKQALVLQGSLLLNIVFDRDMPDVGGLERVKTICSRCGFSADAMKLLDQGVKEDIDEQEHWVKSFTHTDLARLNLVRAFVMNAECLIMHLPLIEFGDAEAARMAELMRLHINERGLELSEEGRKFRRPRTVFYSSPTLDRCRRVDSIIQVTQAGGVSELQMHDGQVVPGLLPSETPKRASVTAGGPPAAAEC